MIRFVVALRAEARPLIDRYQLQPGDDGAFRCFHGSGRSLVISGVGRVAAATATAYLHKKPLDVWVNVGIAGHRDRAPGKLIRAHRVTDTGTGERFYPTLLGLPHIDTEGVSTVDMPETTFASRDVFDMEASGFYQTALRFSTSELVQCVKIVSDNVDTGTDGLTVGRVSELVEQNLDAIDDVVAHLETLATELEPLRHAPDVEPFFETWHFTTSERRRLSRVLVRLRVLQSLPTAEELRRLKTVKTASALLRELDQRLQAVALERKL
ncbi:MAG: hypothetical protein BMS9Abin37_1222 [Acidobacteriota bacterium]|nr:MAG: hypothetical protein BMS9Abin37_1222 [Acidobacteriota bacterium]